ncbi:unnamed protein product [Ilex paraguariensis]|uniref:beta-galactosidase n=1 Tax=Ilex paraguariensis TaxID=185542 RepID=A0ABC8TH90_9AQUA
MKFSNLQINTCNGMMCGKTFAGPNSPNKPSMWTENWTTYYQVYGQNTTLRSAEDIAFHTALFIANKSGSFINYYMYHGGTNFGRTASAYVITSYYDQAPLDEYAVKLCSRTLLFGVPANLSLGPLQEAYIFHGESEECAAFLVNANGRQNVVVQFQNSSYELPPKSISILPDCKTVAFNTAKASFQSVSTQFNTRSMLPAMQFDSAESWGAFKEAVPKFEDTTVRSDTLLEQMNTTKDASDYLWYTFRVQHNSSEAQSVLSVNSLGHVLHAFVNEALVGSSHGTHQNSNFTLKSTVSLINGMNNISLLSAMVGLPGLLKADSSAGETNAAAPEDRRITARDSGPFLEHKAAGPHQVSIQDTQGSTDFTNYSWGYQVGLLGEMLQVYTNEGSSKVQWSKFNSSSQPVTWYKTVFNAPNGNDPVALDLGSMGKGEVWVNGQSIGRYWVSFHTSAGSPSQTWYNVPRSFLKPTGNLLVLFDEEYGNPLGISIDTISITKVCGHVSDSNPPPVISWKGQKPSEMRHEEHHGRRPKIQLHCPPRRNISKILFASFGNPSGDCKNYAVGSCHSANSRAIVEQVRSSIFCPMIIPSPSTIRLSREWKT